MKKMLVTTVVMIALSLVGYFPAHGITLLTQEEADREDLPVDALRPPNTTCKPGECIAVPDSLSLLETKYATGPQIKVLEPLPDVEYKPPIRLIIDFIPKEGTQVDLRSFKLECLKLITINITDRVINYVKPEGIRINEADLPAGEHKLRITLKDTNDGITQQVYLVKIMK